jgi:hypothetical protein
MKLWMLSLFVPQISSSIIDSHNVHINYKLEYQGNIDIFQNNSLRFSTALQDKYYLFNIDYEDSMYPCYELCTEMPGCKGIFNFPGSCIGLSYLGQNPQTTLIPSQSYRKVVNYNYLSNLSCYDRCGINHHLSHQDTKCWCDYACTIFNDCCSDYSYYCEDHCLDHNGGCNQNCENTPLGYVNCSCEENYFIADDLSNCHPENSIVGRIYDNIHEVHYRNISILISNSETNFTVSPDFHGNFMIHNLSDGVYNISQNININCSQIHPTEKYINITIPTDKEYDFYNFCGLNCRCNQNRYLSSCNYVTGFGSCHDCDVCPDDHRMVQSCTNISNTICELITSTPTSTDTTSQTTTDTTSQTTSGTTTQTITDTTTQTITDTTTQTITDTTTQTITDTTSQTTTPTTTLTFTINRNSFINASSEINYQTITIVLAVIISLLVVFVSIYFIKYNNLNTRNNSVSEEAEINSRNRVTFTDEGRNTYDNPVFEFEEPNTNQVNYQDVSEINEYDFASTDNNNGYMDVAPTNESNN